MVCAERRQRKEVINKVLGRGGAVGAGRELPAHPRVPSLTIVARRVTFKNHRVAIDNRCVRLRMPHRAPRPRLNGLRVLFSGLPSRWSGKSAILRRIFLEDDPLNSIADEKIGLRIAAGIFAAVGYVCAAHGAARWVRLRSRAESGKWTCW